MNNQAQIFFWNIPEILNNLVGFLDIASIIELSHVVPKAADLGGGTVIFTRLVTTAGIRPLSRDQANRTQTQDDSVELIERLHPIISLINRMTNPTNAIRILTANVCQQFKATDLEFKAVGVNFMADNREATVTPLGFYLIDWINRMLTLDEPIFRLTSAHVHILASNTLVALTEKAILDGLRPENFSAYLVASETDLEAETILKLATYFKPLEIRSVGLFRGTTGEAWEKIFEAICRMGTLQNDEPGRRGFQVLLNSKIFMSQKMTISFNVGIEKHLSFSMS